MAYSTNFPHLPPPPGTNFPFVGPNYYKWKGKLPGYWYNPYDDHWHPNRNTLQNVAESQGATPPTPKNPSLAQQALPIAVAGGATAAGAALVNSQAASNIGHGITNALGITSPAAPAATTTAAAAPAAATTTAAAPAATTAGTTTTAGVEGAASTTGAAAAPGIGVAPYLGVVGAGLGAYGVHNAIQNHDPKGGAISGAGLGGGLAAAAPLLGFTPVGLPALGLAMLGGAILGGGAAKLFGHKKVKEYEQERLKGLLGLGDKNIEKLVGLGNGQLQDLANDKIKTADPTQLWGSYGMINAFGKDYLSKMNEFQRYAATKAAIDAGLLRSDHGDVLLSDPEKLKSLLDKYYKNKDVLAAYNKWKKSQTTKKEEQPANKEDQKDSGGLIGLGNTKA